MLTLVLDTNIVLDWLLFNDARLDPLRQQLAEQHVVIVTHDFAIIELTRVLGYPLLKLPSERQQALLRDYQQQTHYAAMPEGFSTEQLLLPDGFPRCRDIDDQPFLALCLHAHADALVTHDKALLKLRRRAQQFGVTILDTPALLSCLTDSRRA